MFFEEEKMKTREDKRMLKLYLILKTSCIKKNQHIHF